MCSQLTRLLLLSTAVALLAACGGGGGSSGSSSTMPTPQNGNVSMMVSDASVEDWATIGVKVLSIALVPEGGGNNVTVYSAPSTPPVINLVQLDQLGELIGNASVPAGTYTSAVITISANPGDVLLTAASDPSTSFAGTPGATIPAGDIQIQDAQGTAPNLTVTVPVNFVSPLVVSANENNQFDIEFDLAHPAFIVARTPAGGSTVWAVNFRGPLRHRRVADIRWLVLRHLYGEVTAASGTSMTVTKEFPTEPLVSPETYVTTTQSISISLDQTSGGGTIFYYLDSSPVTPVTISSFSQLPSAVQTALASGTEQVRVAARYQQDGTLVATRIWASSSFDKVWVGPEGHVLHVNPATGMVTMQNDLGQPVQFLVNQNTLIYFRAPQNALEDATPISTNGAQFLADGNLLRGFKVHATVNADLSPMVATSIDIETARYDGVISMPSTTSFTYLHDFRTASDDYQTNGTPGITLSYIPNTTANGTNPVPSTDGVEIEGYKWWDFAYPVTTFDCCGSTAIFAWVSATDGAISFGGKVAPIPAYGTSFASWNSMAATPGWAAAASILEPSLLPLGTVVVPLTQTAPNSSLYSFTMTVPGAAMGTTATIDVNTTLDSATLVYQVDFTDGKLKLVPLDVTQTQNLKTLQDTLTAGAIVGVYAVPVANASNTATAYVLAYYSGDLPPM
ncbi:MAG TPA: DUF4382 domain-containing protein [Steroidobacteraceae bacterium]|nr:DUF4382 domain-containing protein [Steroidobacteraceae bacterium]